MADIKWIKLTVSMFDDEKIDFIDSLPEADTILMIWVRLLTMAGKCNTGGYIFLTENIPYTEEMLAHKFRRPVNVVKLALQTFVQLGMVEMNESGINIINWDKYQNIDGMDRIREQNRLRKQRERERKELTEGAKICDMSRDSRVTVTHSHATDIDIDIDIDNNNVILLQPDEQEFLQTLQTVKGYPLDREKDIGMYYTLQQRYPQLNILESVKDWSVLKLDKPLKPKENPRAQINTSCKKHVEWGRNLKNKGDPQNNGNKRQLTADEEYMRKLEAEVLGHGLTG